MDLTQVPDPGGDGISPPAVAPEKFAQLALELHATDSVEETIQGVVDFALQALNCRFAGVALARNSTTEIPAVTAPIVAEIYRFQLDGVDGPLVECMQHHSPVMVRDTFHEHRWPEWAERVLDLGVRSVLDVPLSTATDTVGVLGLYSTEPDGFDADDEAVAQQLVDTRKLPG
ncbi:GAF domain-containing protein [Kribbella sp. NPDC054772]